MGAIKVRRVIAIDPHRFSYLSDKVDCLVRDMADAELQQEPYAPSELKQENGGGKNGMVDGVIMLLNDLDKEYQTYHTQAEMRREQKAHSLLTNIIIEELEVMEQDIEVMRSGLHRLYNLGKTVSSLEKMNLKIPVQYNSSLIPFGLFLKHFEYHSAVALSERYEDSLETMLTINKGDTHFAEKKERIRKEARALLEREMPDEKDEAFKKKKIEECVNSEQEAFDRNVGLCKLDITEHLGLIEKNYLPVRKEYGSLKNYFEKSMQELVKIAQATAKLP